MIVRRRKQAPVLETVAIDIWPGEFSCFASIPVSDIEVAAWGPFTPGDKITYCSGPKTSAGFTDIWPVAPTYFLYLGTYDRLGASLAVFDLVRENPLPGNFRIVYHRFNDKGRHYLIHHTPANSGRIVQTEEIVYWPEYPPAP